MPSPSLSLQYMVHDLLGTHWQRQRCAQNGNRCMNLNVEDARINLQLFVKLKVEDLGESLISSFHELIGDGEGR